MPTTRIRRGINLPLGAHVRVVTVRAWSIEIQPERDPHRYYLELRYGRRAIGAREYFHNILRDTDPKTMQAATSPQVARAISEARLLVGMTKEEALMAWGYPPFHRTASVSANEWVYYYSPRWVDRVRFVSGKIESITRGPPPE